MTSDEVKKKNKNTRCYRMRCRCGCVWWKQWCYQLLSMQTKCAFMEVIAKQTGFFMPLLLRLLQMRMVSFSAHVVVRMFTHFVSICMVRFHSCTYTGFSISCRLTQFNLMCVCIVHSLNGFSIHYMRGCWRRICNSEYMYYIRTVVVRSLVLTQTIQITSRISH